MELTLGGGGGAFLQGIGGWIKGAPHLPGGQFTPSPSFWTPVNQAMVSS
jgi:hypothetical protein